MKKNGQKFRLKQVIRALRPMDYLILSLVIVVFVVVTTMNTMQMIQMLSNRTQEAGEVRLNSIRYELQETLTNAESSLETFGFGVEELIRQGADEESIRQFVLKQKQEYLLKSDGVTFNTYVASKKFVYIPDFDMPEDYHATERIWYVGAVERPGEVCISDPYMDQMTKKICFTMSKLLEDRETVVAMDFTFEEVQNSINKMLDGQEGYSAMIITDDGMIVGYNDMDYVGRQIDKNLPQYTQIVSRVLASNEHESFVTSVEDDTVTVFSSETKNGWYMIVSVNNTVLYEDSIWSLVMRGVIFLTMLISIVVLYLVSTVNRAKAEQALKDRDRFLNNLSVEMDLPVKRLLAVSSGLHSAGVQAGEQEMKEAVSDIRESSLRLSTLVENVRSFRLIEAEEQGKGKKVPMTFLEQTASETQTDGEKTKKAKQDNMARLIRWFRLLILFVLILSLILNVSVSVRQGRSEARSFMYIMEMQYAVKLNDWVQYQEDTTEMFANYLAVRPELADDYEGCVEWLNDMAECYPEISVCYLANPYREHTVIMNNGWEPGEDWRVEDRQWYRDTVKSEDGFSVSSPYFDEQTGQYCITFSRMVYGQAGEFIGVFGIDFFLDKLITVMDERMDEYTYAFIADSNGDILNHPNKDFEMTADHKVNLADTIYGDIPPSTLYTMKDYDGKKTVAMRASSQKTGFTMVMIADWEYIYSNCIIDTLLGSAILLVGMFLVILMVNRIVRWQEKANRQLKESAAYAEKAGQAKAEFLAQMSHEIRTPINAVIGMDEMILRETEDPQIREYAGNIQSAGRTLLELVNGILDFSKIEEGKMMIVPVRYDTVRLITDMVNMIGERAERKNLIFETEISPDLPQSLYGDDVRIRQIITNLLTNAVKYTPEGSVRLIVEGEAAEGEDYRLKVAVKDTGIGIREEDRSKLFLSFERLDEQKNRNIEGTGLGLAIVQGLLKKMGSELKVESEYGKGSTFSFTLIQQVIDRDPIGTFSKTSGQEEKKEQKSKLILKDAKILFVDDNDMNLKVAKGLMKLYGCQPELTESGKGCLDLVRKSRYDLIFLDHMMPEMDGIETLQRLKAEDLVYDTPVVCLSANAIAGVKEQYLEAGFDDYLSKPIEIPELEEMLTRLLPQDKWERVQAEETKTASKTAADDTELLSPMEQLSRAGFDTAAGIDYCAGMEEFYVEMLRSFADGYEEKRQELEDALAAGSMMDYRTKVHALKSTARMIGAGKLADEALALEDASREEDEARVREGHPDLISDYEAHVAVIRKALSGDK
ncbi:MAG: response regulator [Lachnospiraceae bacterium]|nr:response regulator [Lachnospiraceae bacterium]